MLKVNLYVKNQQQLKKVSRVKRNVYDAESRTRLVQIHTALILFFLLHSFTERERRNKKYVNRN